MNKPLTKQELLSYIEKTWDAAQREAWGERFCDKNCTWLDHHPECDKAEQPAQQEPVAVYVGETWCGSVVRLYGDLPLETPLYTSPQPSKPWVGLTDEEREQIRQRWATQNWMLYDIINAVDAKLKEKNA